MNETRTFGQWLRDQRRNLDLTRVELARQVGYSPEMLKKIEEDSRRPSKELVMRLAEILQVPGAEQARFLRFARRGVGFEALPPFPAADAGNLPTPLTDLVGRQDEIEAVIRMLRQGDVRLLTLIGAPGVGKTRLAMQTALRLQPQFPGGTWFVSLSTISEPELVAQTVAHQLGIGEGPQMASRLYARLGNRPSLLILDNFEQVLPAAAFVADLLQQAAGLKVLITSQEPTRLYGEHRFGVEPLPMETAVTLFARRARAALPDFRLTAENRDAVRTLCERLDRLPLAIELAAARSEYLSPAEILAQLQHATDPARPVLSSPAVNLPLRHRRLWDAIDWGYQLLGDTEARLFRRLGVFVDGWDLASAQAVCGPPVPEAGTTAPELYALLDKSLAYEIPATVPRRYAFLETIQRFALATLEQEGEATTARERHGIYFRKLAQESYVNMVGPQRLARLTRLEREMGNLRAAMEWYLAAEDEAAAEMAGHLRELWYARGYYREGLDWLSRTLQVARRPTTARALALLAAAQLHNQRGEGAEAEPMAREALRISRQLGDPTLIAESLRRLGWIVYDRHDPEAAAAHFQEALALARDLQDPGQIADLLVSLVCVRSQDPRVTREDKLRQLDESLALSRALEHDPVVIFCLQQRGNLAIQAGEYGAAADAYAQALPLIRRQEHVPDLAWQLQMLGEVTWYQGDLQEALDYLQEAYGLFRELGMAEGMAMALHHRGRVEGELGRLPEAARLFDRSLSLHHQAENRHMIARCLAGLGALGVRAGQSAAGVPLLAAAETLLRELPPFLAPADVAAMQDAVARAREALPPPQFQTAWQEGSSLSMAEAVARCHELAQNFRSSE